MTKKNRAKVRRVLLSISLVLVLMMAAVGGTIAWLTDTTDPVENTFTVGNIDIDLTETANKENNDGWEAKLLPGKEYPKDPKVTVIANSEKAWVFVKVKEVKTATYLDYSINTSDWTKLDNATTEENTTVYWKLVETSTQNQVFSVLTGDEVTVKSSLTNQQLWELKNTNVLPSMTFTAYAIQHEGYADAAAAWTAVKDAEGEFNVGASATPWLAPTPAP